MRSHRSLLIISLALLLGACAFNSGTQAPVYTTRHTNEGLIALSGVEINQMFTGSAFQSQAGEWTWVFGAGGTAHARAFDGSWEIKDQKWEIDGDKLCRDLDGAYPCVAVYAVDGVIRFGIQDSNGLEPWAIIPFREAFHP